MASQLKLSQTGFQKLRHLLTPKHLQLAPTKRRQQLRDKFLQEPPAYAIKQSKMKFLRPIAEIQTIMRHFDKKFQQAPHKEDSFSVEIPQGRGKRRGAKSVLHPSDKKLKELINLPTLKALKKRAESYRNILNAEEINQRNDRKQKIMNQFSAYLQKELKSNPTSLRLNTIT